MENSNITPEKNWPLLPAPEIWEETLTTVHMWTQIVGKIRLELSPWINHSWGSVLYIYSKGLTTSPIPYKDFDFQIDLNFTDHKLEIITTKGDGRHFDLEPMSVAFFYSKIMKLLQEMGIEVSIFAHPVEVEEAIPFEENNIHASYDDKAIHKFWLALVHTNQVFTKFRADFIGKSSPSHFFWGAFDLAVTRFSGRTAPKHPGGVPNCADWVMEEAYSHELSSAGFWAGTGLGEPAFYSYAYPAPDGYAQADIKPDGAYYHNELGEYILPYSVVQASDNPDSTLLDFLQTTYEAAADLGNWDRYALEKTSTYNI